MSDQPNARTGMPLNGNLARFTDIFKDDNTLVTRQFDNQLDPGIRCCALFFDGMVNNDLVNKNIVLAIQLAQNLQNDAGTLDAIARLVISANDVKRYGDINELISLMLYGDTLLLLDGENDALVINTKGFPIRSVEEPANEKTLQGPRDGFNESILMNIAQVRRKLQTPQLKFKYQKIGNLTSTKVCLSYIDGVAKPEIIAEAERRLANIKMEGILDSNYIREHIRDGGALSIFKTTGVTERPDIIAAKLLEGRVAIFVDGSPAVLTLPMVFLEMFQTNEDYYTSFYYASINRILRVISFLFTITVPGVYLALVTFHQEIIPTTLLMSIASAQNAVPFPTIVEMLLMLFAFELLREAGSRMPSNIGQALSIVGALVLGTGGGAGEARQRAHDHRRGDHSHHRPDDHPAWSAPCSFFGWPASSERPSSACTAWRSCCFSSGWSCFKLRSFGVEYLSTLSPPNATALHDTIVRFPWGKLFYRNLFKPPLGSDKGGQK